MKEMKSSLILSAFIIFFSFLCLYIFSKVLGPIPFAVNSIQTTKSDLFSATGTGEVSGTPTTARVSLGVTKTATTADEAKNELNKVINAVTKDLKSLGIDEKKIKTTNFSVNPDYTNPELPVSSRPTTLIVPSSNSFTATANLDVETKDVETANKAIDVASAAGANVIGGVSFDLSDEEREKLQDEARTLAIKDAKAKAEKIARAAGLRLGRVVNINEAGGNQPYFMDARAQELKTTDSIEPTDLQPGENNVMVSVTLFYETL